MPRGRVLLTHVGVPLLLYGVAVGAVYLRQESLLFFPTPLSAEYRFRQAGVEERFVEVDGACRRAPSTSTKRSSTPACRKRYSADSGVGKKSSDSWRR